MAEYQNQKHYAPSILKAIADEKLDPKQLTTMQRRLCIRFLLHEQKHTLQEIGAALHVTRLTVWRHKNKILHEDSFMLDEMDEAKEAVLIIQTAETATARLFRKGKEKEAFEVQRQAVEVLQSLGYLKRMPLEFKGQLTLQEILKLASDPKDETSLLGNAGRGSKEFITNGTD